MVFPIRPLPERRSERSPWGIPRHFVAWNDKRRRLIALLPFSCHPEPHRLCHNHIHRIIHCRDDVPFQRVSPLRHPERSAGIPRHFVPRNDRKSCHPEPSFLSSRASARDLLMKRRPEGSDRQEACHPEYQRGVSSWDASLRSARRCWIQQIARLGHPLERFVITVLPYVLFSKICEIALPHRVLHT